MSHLELLKFIGIAYTATKKIKCSYIETIFRDFEDVLWLRNLICRPHFFAEAKPVWASLRRQAHLCRYCQ